MIHFYRSHIKRYTFLLIPGILSANTALSDTVFSNTDFLETEKFSLKSEILKETRNMIIHLPEGYDNTNKNRYSVIYMLDAGNDDTLTATIASQLHTAGIMPKVIVVAIKNIRRGYDFARPYDMSGRGDERRKGNGENFSEFIKRELIPAINKNFKTNDKKIFMGHSAGGAFASYLLSQSPDLFDGFLIFSPAPGDSSDRLFKDFRENINRDINLPEFIYASVGGDEATQFKRSYQRLTSSLKKHTPSKVKLKFETTDGADHMENPERSISSALKFAWKTMH
ncbi:MAG: putative alpha/beta superfamily hydrolase [Flavobacteriales bacterium]|jgi:predicted alpha/beta superfamily hydrolase